MSAEEEIYVSIDLETTGLSSENDRIIEVGAVKFQGDHVLDTYQAIINPYRQIPQFIQHLTGISQSQVDEGADFGSIRSKLKSFIGTCPLVGQNVNFDIGFLTKNGLDIRVPVYDTREMAYVLLPRHAEYSLLPLARSLGIEHPRLHRALDDASVTARVFQALILVAVQLDYRILSGITTLYSRANTHLGTLFFNIQNSRQLDDDSRSKEPATQRPVFKYFSRSQPTSKVQWSGNLNENTIQEILREGGPLSECLPQYHSRQQQLEMATAVAAAFNDDKNLLVEGGTGVGKSIAYLIPALLFAIQNNKTVIISTNTINLQEQLINQDLPTLIGALAKFSPELQNIRFSLLKGRDNYICMNLWKQMVSQENLSADEARVASKVSVWLKDSIRGDRSDMNLAFRDMSTWSRFSAASAPNCPPRTRESCFLQLAKKEADAANVVVVNHALLMRDLVDGGGNIPEYDYLIIDEAHHLEDEATSQLGTKLSQTRIEEYLDQLGGINGVYAQINRDISFLGDTTHKLQMEEQVHDGYTFVAGLRNHSDVLWSAMSTFLRNNHDEPLRRNLFLRVSNSTRIQPFWSKLEIAWEETDQDLARIAVNLDTFISRLRNINESTMDSGVSTFGTISMQISALQVMTEEIRQSLREYMVQPSDNGIYWMTQQASNGELDLNIAPASVGQLLREKLFSGKKGVVLTSATLSTSGDFNHIRDRLGITDSDELIVESPFNYQKSTLFCIPNDMPEPNDSRYQERLQQAIVDICRSSQGSTMALFTSHASLQATREGILNDLTESGFEVIAQGVDGTPRAVLQRFMDNPKSILLGTSSFWEGVDIPGVSLKTLIVSRLPFHVPTDPIFAARSEMFEDPFNQYAIPQSILRFRQGFGRLIRREDDKGSLVVLDGRIERRAYGKSFVESLPRCTLVRGSVREISAAVEQWST